MLQVEKAENGYIVSDVKKTWVFNEYVELARFIRMWLGGKDEGQGNGAGVGKVVEELVYGLREGQVVEVAGKSD